MRKLCLQLRNVGLWAARTIGSELRDCETGKPFGKALVVSWRGRVYVIGLRAAVRPVFLPQKRLTYWKQELGFTMHPPPDFPNVRRAAGQSQRDG